MEWMVVQFTLEERLAIENRARSALRHDNANDVAQLCSQLIRQNAYQERLLSQAVNHIARLEAQPKRRWWQP